MNDPRKTAFCALLSIDVEGGFSNIVVDRMLETADLSAVDKGLFTALVYGVTERRVTLDGVISALSSGTKRIKPYVKNVLRLGLYQILYMDKIPDSAAVNESVKLIKSSKYRFAAGFVNALLRAATRQKDALLPKCGSVDDFPLFYSCADWICSSLISDYGQEAAKSFLDNSLLPPPTYIRVNTKKTTPDELAEMLRQEGVQVEKTELPAALMISGYGSIKAISAYRRGLFHVEDLASQYCCAEVSPAPSDRILDICAAPGGKSFTLAESLAGGSVTACDIHEHRVALIKDGALHLGLGNISARCSDATVFNKDLGVFDKVLCDVPCSGIGVIRRKPEIKYSDRAAADELPALQSGILDNAARYLKSGGRLIYSTCTLRRSENEEVVGRFLAGHSGYKLLKQQTLFPGKVNCDGFFFAVIAKEGE